LKRPNAAVSYYPNWAKVRACYADKLRRKAAAQV
jgi:hypothetical protein